MRCPVHLSIGQEFWLPLLKKQFRDKDRCFSSHRSHSMYMALECDIECLIAELHGSAKGALSGKGGSMHLKDLDNGLEQSNPIVGSGIGFSLGSALASKIKGDDIMTVAYFGDGACEEGILHESLNLARVQNLPILFICENNGYSCNTKIYRRQWSDDMTRFAKAHGINFYSCNMDMSYDSLYNTFEYICQIARNQPAFLEIKSYRYYEHCGHNIDKDKGDRSLQEFNTHYSKDWASQLIDEYPGLIKTYKKTRKTIDALIRQYEEKVRSEISI